MNRKDRKRTKRKKKVFVIKKMGDIRFENGSMSEACGIQMRLRHAIFPNTYEGIPETLLLNVIGWAILILLFSVLRQQAWDYGRLALVSTNGDNKRWTHIFYAPTSDEGGGGGGGSSIATNKINGNTNRNTANGSTATINSMASSNGTSLAGPSGIDMASGSSNTSIHETIQRSSSQNAHIHKQQSIDRTFLSWLPATIRLTREQILNHSGPDAVHYLNFQQHLMCVMVSLFMCVCACASNQNNNFMHNFLLLKFSKKKKNNSCRASSL